MKSFFTSEKRIIRNIFTDIKNIMKGGKHTLKRHLNPRQYDIQNWWSDENAQDFWLSQFIEYHFSTNVKVTFFSCFGDKVPISACYPGVKIFCSGENLTTDLVLTHNITPYSSHRLDEVDLALGFEQKQEANYIRFPLWIWHRDFINPKATLEDIKQKILNINKSETRLNSSRIRFTAQISSHDIGGERIALINLLTPIATIDCAGKFNRNTDELQTVYNDKKEDFLANYRFCICPENSLGDGYITEKVFEAIASGCIPIYWGACLEEGILNPKAILRYEKGKEKELFEQVQRLWTDENAYKEFAMQPPFLDGAAEKIWEMLENLKKKLKPLF